MRVKGKFRVFIRVKESNPKPKNIVIKYPLLEIAANQKNQDLKFVNSQILLLV